MEETMNTLDDGLYHKVTISSWKECNLSGMQ